MAKLTAKQEGFCQSVATGISLSQAYRDNYNTENMSNECIWVKASELMANGKVAVRVAELHLLAQERTLVTVESLTKELNENRAKAESLEQVAAMNVATMGKAKLHGLLVEKVEAKVEADVVVTSPSDKLTGFLDGISKRRGETG